MILSLILSARGSRRNRGDDMATKLTKKQQGELTEKLTGIIQKNNALQLRLSADRSVNEMNVNQISGALNRIHGQAIGKELPTVVTIPVNQTGSGDPSPDNIRPIVGYEIDGIGTVYGGELNIETGTLTITARMFQPESVGKISAHTSGLNYWAFINIGAESINTTVDRLNEYASNMFVSGFGVVIGNFYITSSGTVLVAVPWESEQSITTRDVASEWVIANKPQFIIPLATPETYTLTPQQMMQLLDQL